MSAVELKACPRCQNRAFLVDNGFGAKEVWCVTDRCLRLPPRETAEEAASDWNDRRPPQGDAASIALREALERIANCDKRCLSSASCMNIARAALGEKP